MYRLGRYSGINDKYRMTILMLLSCAAYYFAYEFKKEWKYIVLSIIMIDIATGVLFIKNDKGAIEKMEEHRDMRKIDVVENVENEDGIKEYMLKSDEMYIDEINTFEGSTKVL